MDNHVQLKGVHFSQGDHVIFSGIDINIERGKITAIMGPSGSGKTTLLRLIAAQIAPSQGEVRVDGENIHRLSRRNLYKLRQRVADKLKDE